MNDKKRAATGTNTQTIQEILHPQVKRPSQSPPPSSAEPPSSKDISNFLAQQRTELRKERRRHGRYIRYVVALLVIVILLNFVVSAAVIHTNSMAPTFYDGDTCMIWKLGSSYERGDVVLFKTQSYGAQILRVVGMPGDSVEISKDGKVLVNGSQLEEPYVTADTVPADVSYPVSLGENEYFLLGDNRENAMDSRFSAIGSVPGKQIKGRLFYLLRGI